MGSNIRRYLRSFLIYLIFSYSFLFPKNILAKADLVLTNYDICWEIYEHSVKGELWKRWVLADIKNDGDEGCGYSVVQFSFPGGGVVSVDPLTAGGTQRIQETWIDWPDVYKCHLSDPSDCRYAGAYCKTAEGYQGFWNTSNVSGAYCGSVLGMVIRLDVNNEINEGSGTPEFNNIKNINLQSDGQIPPDSVVPGHYNWLCNGMRRIPTPAPTIIPINTPTPSKISTPTPSTIEFYPTFEAEVGNVIAPMVKVYDKKASDCYYLHSPEGSGHGKGYVTYNVDIPKTGYYVVFGRVNGVGWSSDSFYLSWDNGAEINWPLPHGWQWSRANDNGTPKNWNLTKGRHTLKIRTREDGSQIDALVVVNNYNYQPTYFKTCR